MNTKMVKKGFTLIELIVVMVILGILVGAAVFKLNGSDKGAYLSTMKNDARAAIALENNAYATYQEFIADGQSADNSANKDAGQFTLLTQSDEQMTLNVSPYNSVYFYLNNCTDGSLGYTIKVYNPKVNKHIQFNSCTDGGIKVFKN